MESNSDDSLNLGQIRENFDFREPLLSLDEDEDEKLYFISNENSEKNFNFRYNRNSKKKRGLKRNKESKKAEHNIYSNDNITSKIQIHFLNFIVSFLNDSFFPFEQKNYLSKILIIKSSQKFQENI